MKKHFFAVVLAVTMTGLLVVSCPDFWGTKAGPVVYTVRFNANGGSPEPENQSVTHGERAKRPADPAKADYAFGSWYTEAGLYTVYDFWQPVTGDITLYAKYLPLHTVTFDSTGGDAVESQQVADGRTANRPSNPAKEHYGFGGWFVDDQYSRQWDFGTDTVTRPITLYAYWDAHYYTVSFNSTGGDAVASQDIAYNGTATLPADPEKEGVIFGGWYTDNTTFTSAYDFDTPVSGSITLYAKWNEVTGVVASPAGIAAWLAGQSGGAAAATPAELPLMIRLTDANWRAILNAVSAAGKYVNMDLSRCTRSTEYSGGGLASSGKFDPLSALSTGKDKIVSIVLPDAALRIGDTSSYDDYLFRNCANLASISGANITSIGQSAFYGCTALIRVDFPKTESIGQYAFLECTALVQVDFPKTESIGTRSFYGCTNLTTVNMPALVSLGSGSFTYCAALVHVDFPAVTSIGSEAFSDCTGLVSVNFPLAERIRLWAFQNCTALVTVSFPNVTTFDSNDRAVFVRCTSLISADFPKLQNIGITVFYDCTQLEYTNFPLVQSIGALAFLGCKSLVSVNVPLVESIGHGAFSGCSSLVSVSFPAARIIDSVFAGFEWSTFYNCTRLERVDAPLLESIGAGAFEGCTRLEQVNTPLVESIGAGAFKGCTRLERVDTPLVESIGEQAFYDCTSLTSADYPKLTTIEASTFEGCTSLVSINVNFSMIESIGEFAFYYCTSLTSADYPKVTTIEKGAFVNCSSLVNINFPLVKSIGNGAFGNCTGLTSLAGINAGVQTIGASAFAMNTTSSPAISSLSFPEAVSIGYGAFSYWHNLVSISLPKATVISGDSNNNYNYPQQGTFANCTKLTTVDIPLAETIGYGAFYGCTALTAVSFPAAQTVRIDAFRGCTKLTTVDLPAAQSLGGGAFRDCTALVNISFPNVTTIYYEDNRFVNGAFYGCTSLASASFPNVVSIGGCAFMNCFNLASVSFPKAESIGLKAFVWQSNSGILFPNTKLVSVDIPNVKTIGMSAFALCTALSSGNFPAAENIEYGAFSSCTSLASINIPASARITGIPFDDCSSLTFTLTGTGPLSVQEGGKALVRNNTELLAYPSASGTVTMNTITSIGDYAFAYSSIVSVSFPAATSIGQYAFNGCTRLATLSIPSVTSLGFYALGRTGNTALTITMGNTAPAVGHSMFFSVNTAKTVTVKVPAGATGYGTVPATYSGTNAALNWGNAFRGIGWDPTKAGTTVDNVIYDNNGYISGLVSGYFSETFNRYVTLNIQQQ